MSDLLRRVFRVHKGEGRRIFYFALLGALLQAGLAIAVSTSDSLFLVHVGVKMLPRLYVTMPVVMLAYLWGYSYLVARFRLQYILESSLAIVALGGFAFYGLLASSQGNAHDPLLPSIFYVAKIFSGLWYIGLYTQFWSFTDAYFDIQDAKRLFALFSGGGAFGAIIGGALVATLSNYIPVENLYLVWACLAVLTLPVVRAIGVRYRVIDADEVDPESARKAFSETVGAIRNSPFAKALLVVIFAAVALTTLLEFQYSTVFSEGRTDEQLARLFGELFIDVSVFNLLINFFVFNRLVNAVGVGQVALVGPAIYIIAFTLMLINFGMGAAVFGFFAYQGVIASIDWNNANLLFNAVPSGSKARVRAFGEGLMEPMATALAGWFLLYAAKSWSSEGLAMVGLIGAAIYLVISLVVRGNYLASMVSNLKREWLDFSAPMDVKGELDTHDRALLLDEARGTDIARKSTALDLLTQADPEDALEPLLGWMKTCGEEERPVAASLLETTLHDENPEVIRRLLDWMDREQYDPSPDVLLELGAHGLVLAQDVAPLLRSGDPQERAAAAAASWDSWDTGARLQGLETVNALMKGNTAEVVAGIRALGRSADERYAHFLAGFFQDSNSPIRAEALRAARRLVNRDSARLVPVLLNALRGVVPTSRGAASGDERALAMEALARIGDPECISGLLDLAADFTPFEKRRAEDVLGRIGLKSVPAIVTLLRDPRRPFNARSIAARALSRIAFPQVALVSLDIIRREIHRAYEFAFHRLSLEASDAAGPGYAVLRRYYTDMHEVIVDFVLEILAVGGRIPDFELISASLRSDNRKERGNAIETIEQALPRHDFKMLLPLIDITRTTAERIELGRRWFQLVESTPREIALQALRSPVPIAAAAAAQALHDTSSASDVTLLRGQLREKTEPLFRSTVVSLLSRNGDRVRPNVVEKIAALAYAPFFEPFSIVDLEVLSRQATLQEWKAGDTIAPAGDAATYLYVILRGTVLVGGERVSSPGVAGEEAALALRIYGASLQSEDAAGLAIPSSAFEQACLIRAPIATALLRKQVERLASQSIGRARSIPKQLPEAKEAVS